MSVLLNTSSGNSLSFADKVSIEVQDPGESLAVGDVDGDGKYDVIVTGEKPFGTEWVSILRNTSTVGSVSFDTNIDYSVPNWPKGVSLIDLDSDSKPEIVVARYFTTKTSILPKAVIDCDHVVHIMGAENRLVAMLKTNGYKVLCPNNILSLASVLKYS